MVIRHDLYERRSLMGYAAQNLEEVKLGSNRCLNKQRCISIFYTC